MPNVARWFFKGFRQPNVLSGQEILLRQEKLAPIARFDAKIVSPTASLAPSQATTTASRSKSSVKPLRPSFPASLPEHNPPSFGLLAKQAL